MPLIRVADPHKEFRVQKHPRGAKGAIRNLFTCEYRVARAADGVSFAIEAGERVGYLGPNGAGKSTTIKMLTGSLTLRPERSLSHPCAADDRSPRRLRPSAIR